MSVIDSSARKAIASLEYGMLNERVVHVSTVQRGLDCDCRCPGCGDRLIAKKGEILREHFAHYGGSECQGALESAVHKLAKQVFLEHSSLKIPRLNLSGALAGEIFEELIVEERVIHFDRVDVEFRNGSYTPDAVGWIRDRCLFVEFKNTHEVDSAKCEKIIIDDISTLEVDISHLSGDRLISSDDILLCAPRTWVHHTGMRSAEERLQKRISDRRTAIEQSIKSREDKMEAKKQRSKNAREPTKLLALSSKANDSSKLPYRTSNILHSTGLDGLVGKEIKSSWVMTAGLIEWQTKFLEDLYIKNTSGALYKDDIVKWLHRLQLSRSEFIYATNDNIKYIEACVNDFRRPQDVVHDYIAYLSGFGLFYRSIYDSNCYDIDQLTHDAVIRGMQIQFNKVADG